VVKKEITDSEAKIFLLQTSINNQDPLKNALPPEHTVEIKNLQSELADLQRKNANLSDAIERQEYEIADSRDFVESMIIRLSALDDSIATKSALGSLPLTHCPHCLSELQLFAQDGECVLCHQTMNPDNASSNMLRMRNELFIQIKESNVLLDGKQKHLEELRLLNSEVERTIKVRKRRFDLIVGQVKTKRDAQLDSMLITVGMLENNVDVLNKHLKAVAVISNMTNNQWNIFAKTARFAVWGNVGTPIGVTLFWPLSRQRFFPLLVFVISQSRTRNLHASA
jgi:hypothetical protein